MPRPNQPTLPAMAAFPSLSGLRLHALLFCLFKSGLCVCPPCSHPGACTLLGFLPNEKPFTTCKVAPANSCLQRHLARSTHTAAAFAFRVFLF